jgi:phosphomannomutase
MPVDSSGNYQMNAQKARAGIGGKKAAPIATPAAGAQDDPNDPNGNVKSITITANPDGTFHTSEPNGEENDFQDFQSAMGKAQECLGASAEPDADDQGAPALDQPSSGSSGNDVMGA